MRSAYSLTRPFRSNWSKNARTSILQIPHKSARTFVSLSLSLLIAVQTIFREKRNQSHNEFYFYVYVLQAVDASLETKSASVHVEEILADFSSRQFNITESWENWTSTIVEKRETERIIEEIMSKHELVSTQWERMRPSSIQSNIFTVHNFNAESETIKKTKHKKQIGKLFKSHLRSGREKRKRAIRFILTITMADSRHLNCYFIRY